MYQKKNSFYTYRFRCEIKDDKILRFKRFSENDEESIRNASPNTVFDIATILLERKFVIMKKVTKADFPTYCEFILSIPLYFLYFRYNLIHSKRAVIEFKTSGAALFSCPVRTKTGVKMLSKYKRKFDLDGLD